MSKRHLTVRVTDSLWSRIESYAHTNEISRSEAVEYLLGLMLEKLSKRKVYFKSSEFTFGVGT